MSAETHLPSTPAPAVYEPQAGDFDVYARADGPARAAVNRLLAHMGRLGPAGLARLQRDAEVSLRNQGITFTVYADERGTEKILPFDVVPRVIEGPEWRRLEAGIAQRLQAIQLLLADLYGPQRVLRDGVIPSDLVLTSPLFCREMAGLRPPGDVWVHVAGIDLIQDAAGVYRVLEDNLRVPSGVSYVLENRRISSRIMPELLQRCGVRSVDHYAPLLLGALRSLTGRDDPTIGVLTPGVFNSAYFEHSFLAAEMGVELVEGQDLVVDQDVLYMRTTAGLRRVDLLYRRVDDEFLDPLVFRPDSILGVPGLVHAVRAGNLVVANTPGTGVVDDKALYPYLPAVLRYFLDDDPILEQVPTYSGRNPAELSHMREHLETLVLKPVDGAGGYGVVIGPAASAGEIGEARAALEARPEAFVAQPVQRLSTVPTLASGSNGDLALEPRHVDLRPFAVVGRDGGVNVLPGGLTRVALRRGSLIVNSSQGGGSKDTWVLSDVQG